MPNRTHQRGANFERQVIKKLETEGWRCTRAAGSHGPGDIWAAKKAIYANYDLARIVTSDLWHIQCKLGRVTGKDLRALVDLCRDTGGTAIIASKRNGQIIMREIKN